MRRPVLLLALDAAVVGAYVAQAGPDARDAAATVFHSSQLAGTF